MALGFVMLQNSLYLCVKGWIKGVQTLAHILMYGAFAYSVLLCCKSYSCLVLSNEFSQFNGAFLYCALHNLASRRVSLLTLYVILKYMR